MANSKNHLTEQLVIADSFNRYNGIKVNPDKSKLIVINNSEKTKNDSMIKYGTHEQEISPLKQTDFTRFSGKQKICNGTNYGRDKSNFKLN